MFIHSSIDVCRYSGTLIVSLLLSICAQMYKIDAAGTIAYGLLIKEYLFSPTLSGVKVYRLDHSAVCAQTMRDVFFTLYKQSSKYLKIVSQNITTTTELQIIQSFLVETLYKFQVFKSSKNAYNGYIRPW